MGRHCRVFDTMTVRPRGLCGGLLLLALSCVDVAAIAGPACGAPSYDKAVDTGLFLWESNCDGPVSTFEVVALGDGSDSPSIYDGQIATTGQFTSLTGRALEGNDQLQLLKGDSRIDYRLKVKNPWFDGFSFDVAGNASTCFGGGLPPGTTVSVGPSAIPVAVPFDVRTLQSCSGASGTDMNFVVIVTDDQRWDTMWSTPSIDALAAGGMMFANAFVSEPVCGPVRASLLSGGFRASNTGIISNLRDISPLTSFNDNDTLAVRLQQAGYQTAFIGKYHNLYRTMKTHVPPGWTRWVANNRPGTWYDFTVTTGSSTSLPSTGTLSAPIPQYITDFHRDEVLSFLDGVGGAPFFVYWAADPPHGPATPLPEDAAAFSGYEYRDRAWGEVDLSDKPAWLSNPSRNLGAKSPDDEFHRDQLRSLQAVDRSVAAIVQKVQEIGQADNTVFFFLSDNGYLWGEHGLSGKGVAYEESLRVPLAVFGAGIPSGIDDRLVYADLDLAPTIIDLAGLPAAPTDGESLVPILAGKDPIWRSSLLFENWGHGSNGPYATWAALRTEIWKYVRQANGEEELYDLVFDPYEEESLHEDPAFDDVRSAMAAQLDAEKSLAGRPLRPSNGNVGVPFFHQLEGWGGSGTTYRWYLNSDTLPDGLVLNTGTGVISGIPTTVGLSEVQLRIEDGTLGTHSGLPRQHVYTIRIKIKP